MYRALVVEDQDLMRLALMAELEASRDDCWALGAQTFELACELLACQHFDLIVIDPGLPGIDPTSSASRLTVIRQLMEHSSHAAHIIITGSDSAWEAQQCEALGAASYLAKTGLCKGMLASILRGDCTSSDAFCFRPSRPGMTSPDFRCSQLTEREQEVINRMLGRQTGMKRKQVFSEMAERHCIDTGTAEKYYKQARKKLIKHNQLPRGL
ncbi:response regulator transcription factor [Ochrobactrum quorumnocens]|uniref:Response regulator transcription factor n=1 Tax=Ochrobactrum quorumnocens TaxID=271865 RepID=A0A5N1K252_9HYPH|nr:response regulator [[Ochrobactrum] quorumnocens]KAA9368344.1 response regulator transcription factor [[Ochrobactrum] quorumnocens]